MRNRSPRTPGSAVIAATAVAIIASGAMISAIARRNAKGATQPPVVPEPALLTPNPKPRQLRRLLWLLSTLIVIVILGRAAVVLPVPDWARWILTGAAMAVTASIVIALLLGPGARRLAGEHHPLTADERKQMTATERIEAVNAARHTLIQAATGLVIIGGVVFTAQGFWYTAESLETSRQAQLIAAQGQRTAEQGQITDRYTKAVEQLGSTKLDIRLGGIYALERLAIDSPRDHLTVYDVLAAFLHEHDPQLGAKLPIEPATDIQASLTVIGRRNPTPGGRALNLAGTRLRGADLPHANLGGVNLSHVDLRGANLENADLHSVSLDGSNMRYAYLGSADLRNSELPNADLREVNLPDADLRNAFLGSANLSDADLRGADLRGADLANTILHDADLSGADLRGADLTGILGATEKEIRSQARVDASTRF